MNGIIIVTNKTPTNKILKLRFDTLTSEKCCNIYTVFSTINSDKQSGWFSKILEDSRRRARGYIDFLPDAQLKRLWCGRRIEYVYRLFCPSTPIAIIMGPVIVIQKSYLVCMDKITLDMHHNTPPTCTSPQQVVTTNWLIYLWVVIKLMTMAIMYNRWENWQI